MSAGAEPPVYVDLPEACAAIDRRHTRYRFDLEKDVPWDGLGEPGDFFGPGFLEGFGIDVAGLRKDPENKRTPQRHSGDWTAFVGGGAAVAVAAPGRD